MPKIVVWDTSTMDVKAVLKGYHRREVTKLAFSGDGTFLATIGLDDRNSIAVYNWRTKQLMCQNVTSGNRVLACSFIPGDAGRVVVAGKSHLTFFSRASGSAMHSQRGMFGKRLAGSISITCTAYTHETLLVCGSNLGHICVWDYTAGTAMLPMGSGPLQMRMLVPSTASGLSQPCHHRRQGCAIRIWQGKGIALNLLESSPLMQRYRRIQTFAPFPCPLTANRSFLGQEHPRCTA